jgi:hypothetical protein
MIGQWRSSDSCAGWGAFLAMTSILASSRQQTRLTAATLSPPVEVAGVIKRCGRRRNCLSDLPLLLDAQDLAEVDARDRRERRALAGRRAARPSRAWHGRPGGSKTGEFSFGVFWGVYVRRSQMLVEVLDVKPDGARDKAAPPPPPGRPEPARLTPCQAAD